MDSRTQRYFDHHAAQFDAIYHEGQPIQRVLNRTFRKAIYQRFAITFEQAGDVAGKTVLDVGCGSGRYAVEFAKRGASRVVGVDYAPGMLALAREYAEAKGVAARCEFIQGDFTAQMIDQRFDVVIAIGVFDYQDRPVEFLRKMGQHCSGRLIATFPGRSLIRMPLRKFRYWLGNCPVLFYREQEVRDIATRAGLRRVTIIPIHTSGTGFVLVGDV
jgi:2-polyprenyl-3-methyl-5-hydroxy-6-metoxy-1,4-benzoquinol methylase